ncbi:regulatory protein RecX [Tolypothrix campylonemoides VB511288]|nr:regulatory protein RecX [Tolypothrix campylonemoides VB511288]
MTTHPDDDAPVPTGPDPDTADGSSDPGAGRPSRRGSRRQERTPLQAALSLLTRREHSRRELQRKLAARGHGDDAVGAAIEKLADAGWQDDARFAASLVRSRVAAGYGPLHIRAELGTHGLDREAAQRAMDAEAVDWNDAARDLVRRRFGTDVASDVATRRRAADFLIRRGFTGDAVRAATRWDPSDD